MLDCIRPWRRMQQTREGARWGGTWGKGRRQARPTAQDNTFLWSIKLLHHRDKLDKTPIVSHSTYTLLCSRLCHAKIGAQTSSEAFWIMPFTKGLLVNSTSPVTRRRLLPLPSLLTAHCTFWWKDVPYGTCTTPCWLAQTAVLGCASLAIPMGHILN